MANYVPFDARTKRLFFERFKALCVKRLYDYHPRRSSTSYYVEVKVKGKVYLFRFSDHPIADGHAWVPDFNIQHTKAFKQAINFLKSFDTQAA